MSISVLLVVSGRTGCMGVINGHFPMYVFSSERVLFLQVSVYSKDRVHSPDVW